MGLTCGTDPRLERVYQEEKPQIESIIRNREAAAHVEDAFPAFYSEAEKKFNKHEGEAVESIRESRDMAERKLRDLKEQVSLRYGGAKEFEKQKGASLDKYLNTEEELGRFKTLERMVNSEFVVKRNSLLASLHNRKDTYLAQLLKEQPSAPGYESLTLADQKLLAKHVSGPMKEGLRANNFRVMDDFKAKAALPLLEANLLDLDSEKQAREHFHYLCSSWTKKLDTQ
jgi:hypothetical protein